MEESLVYRVQERHLHVRPTNLSWSFTGDGATWKLAAEARRIALAHLFDPMLAVYLSRLDPLPHQIRGSTARCCPASPCASCWPTTRMSAITGTSRFAITEVRGD
ncbi:MAG: hypothetical protein ACRDZQ_13565 [Acidimicrobiales bacterium]